MIENQQIDKVNWRDDFLKNISAFANSEGGTLYIGINDKGEAVEVSINKLLADIFYKVGFIESWGRSTLKIIRECKKASIPEPNFYEEHGVVKIIFELTGGLIPPLYGGLNGGQQKVFQVIQGKEGVKSKEIAELLGIPIDTIDKHIKVLINKNFIEHRGSKKTGGYFIVNPPSK